MEPGSGVQLALKLVIENLGKSFIVTSKDPGHTVRAEMPFLTTEHPSIEVDNPAAFASALLSENQDRQVVCFVDERTTERHINSVIKSNVLYICYNMSGRIRFARTVGLHKYAASASVAYPDDLKSKLAKAMPHGRTEGVSSGFGGGFIEILTPCPKGWGYDSSNTVVVSRSAVESGSWILYEIANKKFVITYKPAKLESLDILLNLQKRLRVEQGTINKNWKLIVEDRYWELE